MACKAGVLSQNREATAVDAVEHNFATKDEAERAVGAFRTSRKLRNRAIVCGVITQRYPR